MTDEDRKILESSRDHGALAGAAIAAARSPEPAHHALLLKHLKDPEFLLRLDSEEEYRESHRFRLRVARVVEALARNPAPDAQKAFEALTHDKHFLADEARTDALIRASAHAAAPSGALVKFWDDHFQPEDGFSSLTITALVENGSVPAAALLEKKFVDPKQSESDKLGWMRSDLLAHRNDLHLLEACERMLKGSLTAHLRPALVEVLFDYRPEEWFKPSSRISVPPLRDAKPPALVRLREIGHRALKTVALNDAQKAAVKVRLDEIDKLLP